MSSKLKINVESKVLDKPKTKEQQKIKQLRHSNFFITINTNKRYTGNEEDYEEFIEKFKNSIDNQFTNDNIVNLIKVQNEEHELSEKYIKNIDIQSAIELGPTTGTIHSHILVKIAHYTNVRLEYQYFKEQIMKDMGLKNIFMNVKLYRNANDTLERYLFKNQ